MRIVTTLRSGAPGCYSWGYTYEEALRNIKKKRGALGRNLAEDGEPIPEEIPKSLKRRRLPSGSSSSMEMPLRNRTAREWVRAVEYEAFAAENRRLPPYLPALGWTPSAACVSSPQRHIRLKSHQTDSSEHPLDEDDLRRLGLLT